MKNYSLAIALLFSIFAINLIVNAQTVETRVGRSTAISNYDTRPLFSSLRRCGVGDFESNSVVRVNCIF